MNVITVKFMYRTNPVVYTAKSYKVCDQFLTFYAENKGASVTINMESVEELEIMKVEG